MADAEKLVEILERRVKHLEVCEEHARQLLTLALAATELREEKLEKVFAITERLRRGWWPWVTKKRLLNELLKALDQHTTP